ncbi:hypothetical protein DL93DRAFT_772124 [Clavulina sp. PMI_390]|nr:hypothetical protein DL93DRAFT_772124 [Clavulina sp. PMI_390]
MEIVDRKEMKKTATEVKGSGHIFCWVVVQEADYLQEQRGKHISVLTSLIHHCRSARWSLSMPEVGGGACEVFSRVLCYRTDLSSVILLILLCSLSHGTVGNTLYDSSLVVAPMVERKISKNSLESSSVVECIYEKGGTCFPNGRTHRARDSSFNHWRSNEIPWYSVEVILLGR